MKKTIVKISKQGAVEEDGLVYRKQSHPILRGCFKLSQFLPKTSGARISASSNP
jgi:hypothetical protein